MKIQNGKIGELSYLNSAVSVRAEQDFYLAYSMNGTVEIKRDNYSTLLKENELLCIQTARIIQINPQGVCVLLRISNDFMSLFELKEYIIKCDPSYQNQIAYQEVITGLSELIALTDEPSVSSADLISKLTLLIEKLKQGFGKRLDNDGDLIAHVKEYLSLNFQQDCSLLETANRFSVTPQYLSKRFKDKIGINFAKYLTHLRLEHSLADLQYSDDSILDVALNNGFSSLSTFNRTFKAEYKLSPAQYRRDHFDKIEGKTSIKDINNEELEASLAKMRFRNSQQQTILLRADQQDNIRKPVLADTISLSYPPTRKTIEILQRLKIRYVKLTINLPEQIDNLYLLELNQRIEPLLRAAFPIIFSINDSENKNLSSNLRRLFGYFANIISVENVAKWFIEIDSSISNEIAEIKDAFADLGILPGFIVRGDFSSLSAISIDDVAFNLVSTEDKISTLIYQSQQLRIAYPNTELFVTYPGIANQNLRKLNDTNFAAAKFLDGAFKLVDAADHIALQSLQDDEHQTLINGQTGLLTHSLIRKPIFYAVNFLNRQTVQLFETKENYLISYDGVRNYAALITNNSIVRTTSTAVDYDNFHSVLIEKHAKKIFKVTNLPNGRYMIKRRSENDLVSLIKLWTDLGRVPKLNLEEYDYLNRKTAPDMVIRQIDVVDHQLKFEFEMQPDELIYIHLIYLY